MKHYRTALHLLLCLIWGFSPITYAQKVGVNKTGAQLTNDFSSPQAVFNSFREAGAKSDWHRRFRCLTPNARRKTLFELFFQCAESGSAQAQQIVTDYIGDRAMFQDEYRRKHQAKYGKAASPPCAGPTDMDLFTDTLYSRIEDKAGFYAAVSTFFLGSDSAPPIGELEQLVVDGDKATGRSKVIVRSTQRSPGQAPRTIAEKVYKTYEFRNVNGEWLIESQ